MAVVRALLAIPIKWLAFALVRVTILVTLAVAVMRTFGTFAEPADVRLALEAEPASVAVIAREFAVSVVTELAGVAGRPLRALGTLTLQAAVGATALGNSARLPHRHERRADSSRAVLPGRTQRELGASLAADVNTAVLLTSLLMAVRVAVPSVAVLVQGAFHTLLGGAVVAVGTLGVPQTLHALATDAISAGARSVRTALLTVDTLRKRNTDVIERRHGRDSMTLHAYMCHGKKIKVQDPQDPASSIHFRILGSQCPTSNIHFRIQSPQGSTS